MARVSKSFPAIAVVAASLVLAACGSSSSSSSSSASPTQPASSSSAGNSSGVVIKTASNAKLGSVLVDSQGMTLYALSAERGGKWICTSSGCLQVWHPVTVAAGTTPTGVASLSVVKRPDGTEQVTYKGEPLYTFSQDKAPGQANGQGIKDVGVWGAVTVGAAKPASSSSGSSGSSTPSSGGSSYAY